MGHAHFCQRLFQLDVNHDGKVERSGKAAKAGKLDYIAAREAEAELAREAGSVGGVEDEATAAVEERELAQRAESAGEASSTGTRAPLIEDVVNESTEEEAEAIDLPAAGRRHVLCRADSGEPVRPGKTVQRQEAPEESVRQTRAAAAKKAVKTTVAKKKAIASSLSKSPRTPPASPPPADADTEVVFDFGDMETLAQRVAKRSKASTGDKPPAGEERQQEEPLRATLNTPPPSAMRPQRASPARAPSTEPTPMEEETDLGAGGPTLATKVGGEGATSSQPGADPPLMDQENVDAIIGEVAKDDEAEATKIAAEEAAKTAEEEADKGSAGGAGGAAAEEAGKAAAAEEAGKAAAGEEETTIPPRPQSLPRVVDEPSTGSSDSQEERLLWAMGANFRKLHALHRTCQDKIRSRMAVVDKAEADFKERVTETQAWLRDTHQELKDIQGELA
nr:fibrous sheath CABYR-binding protein-like [Aegilops tauschii subsp. strangulata]